jgi:hypothetical protein
MPILDVKCRHCSVERELIVCQTRDHHGILPSERVHFLRCTSSFCKNKMRRFYVVDRVHPSAIRFVDGVSQWESNDKKAKALREGKH